MTHYVKVSPFSGSLDECYDDFEHLLKAAINLGNIPATRQHAYLKLHLCGGALKFYLSLPNETQNNFEDATEALRNRYANNTHREIHAIKFHARTFNPEKESLEEYLTDLQRMASKAFPNIPATTDSPIKDLTDERQRRVHHQFIDGLPTPLKCKAYEWELSDTTKLCQKISRFTWIKDTCTSTEPVLNVAQISQNNASLDDDIAELREGQLRLTTSLNELMARMQNITEQLDDFALQHSNDEYSDESDHSSENSDDDWRELNYYQSRRPPALRDKRIAFQ